MAKRAEAAVKRMTLVQSSFQEDVVPEFGRENLQRVYEFIKRAPQSFLALRVSRLQVEFSPSGWGERYVAV